MSDDLYLTRTEIQQTATRLHELANWICDDLDSTLCRQVAFTDRTNGRVRGKGETPNVYNERASEVAHDLHDVLRTWVEHTCIHNTHGLTWPGEQRPQRHAQWLNRHLIDLAKTEEAPQAADEIKDCWQRAKQTIDRPQPQEFVGPCQSTTDGVTCEGVYCHKGADTKKCQPCGITIDIPSVKAATMEIVRETLGTAAELAAVMPWFHGKPIPRKRITYLAQRGLISTRPGPDGPRYQLGEVVDAHTALLTRRNSRDTA